MIFCSFVKKYLEFELLQSCMMKRLRLSRSPSSWGQTSQKPGITKVLPLSSWTNSTMRSRLMIKAEKLGKQANNIFRRDIISFNLIYTITEIAITFARGEYLESWLAKRGHSLNEKNKHGTDEAQFMQEAYVRSMPSKKRY
jgi:hypothetical protein